MRGDDEWAVSNEPGRSASELPGLVRASELTPGRRCRRTAAETGVPPEDVSSSESACPPDRGESADPETRAREICLRLLTGADRTRKQLADALHRRGIPAEAAEAVLSRFEEVGLIDDAAFAEAWVQSRQAGRGLARPALAHELRTRGVADALVRQAVARVDAETEEAAARALVERRLRATRGLDRRTRIRRLAGMLARRGHSEGLALRVVLQALDNEPDG